jgi:nucleoside-diphosphate-sugar epimerase
MRLLLSGADGFTGVHLTQVASNAGFEVIALQAPLEDSAKLHAQLKEVQPTHVIHLAAISHVTHDDDLAYYQTNLLGSLDFLEALSQLASPPQKVILASSANVYGNAEGAEDTEHAPIAESQTPAPVNHYAMSKLAMELLARNFSSRLPIVTTRPFNYTGVGHGAHFVIPKIVDHFARKASVIELGNVDVYREYNDVRDISNLYLALLERGLPGQTYNLASGRTHSLRQVIAQLESMTGHLMAIKVNPQFVRQNEIMTLCGSSQFLEQTLGTITWRSLDETLQWMLKAKVQ